MDGQKIATQTLGGGTPVPDFIEVYYPMRPALIKGKAKLTSRFRSSLGEIRAMPIYDIRL